MTYDCTAKGHHNHEPDGAIYVRHQGRPRDQTTVVCCCHCGTTTEDMPLYSRDATPDPTQRVRSVVPCAHPDFIAMKTDRRGPSGALEMDYVEQATKPAERVQVMVTARAAQRAAQKAARAAAAAAMVSEVTP